MAIALKQFLKTPQSARGLLAGLLCFFIFPAAAQQDSTFRIVLGNEDQGYGVLNANSVIEKGDFYYTYSQHFEVSVQNWGAVMTKINKQGQVVKVQRIVDSVTIFFPPVTYSVLEWHPGQNRFISQYGMQNVVKTNGLFLFDTNLENWDTIRYHPPEQVIFDQFFDLVVLPQNDIIVAGEVVLDGQEKVVAHLVKYNAQLEVEWSRTYSDTGRIAFRPRHVYPAPQGGYLIAGYRRLWGPGVPSGLETVDPLLIRTDSLGNLLWQKTYGGPLQDWKGATAAYRDDGTIVMYYAEGVRQISPDRFDALPVFSLVNDKTGEVIREKRFPELREFMFHGMDLVRDGKKFIAAGKLAETDKPAIDNRGSGQSYLFAVNKELEELFYRQYTLKDDNAPLPEDSYFYSLCKTSDGGYLAGGQADLYDPTGVPNAHAGLNGMVFKLDSNACIRGTACVDTFGVAPVDTTGGDTTGVGDTTLTDTTGPQSLQIYPNPSRRVFTIEWAAAPNARVELYNLQGQQVGHTQLHNGKATLELRPTLPPGLYLVRVTASQEGEQHVRKVLWQGGG